MRFWLPTTGRAGISDLRRLSNWLLDRFVGELLMRSGKEGPLARQSLITYTHPDCRSKRKPQADPPLQAAEGKGGTRRLCHASQRQFSASSATFANP